MSNIGHHAPKSSKCTSTRRQVCIVSSRDGFRPGGRAPWPGSEEFNRAHCRMGRAHAAPFRGRVGQSCCSEVVFENSASRAGSECRGVDRSGAQRRGSMRPAVRGGCGWMFGGLIRYDRRCAWRRCAREPLAQFRVDTRVIQKVEVVRAFQHEPLLARKGQLSILTRAGRAVGAD